MKRWLKWCITVILLVLLGLVLDWRELLGAAHTVRAWPYLLSLLALFLSVFLIAYRLRVLLQATPLSSLSTGRLLSIHLSSFFYGFLAPSEVASAAIRWYQVTGNKRGRTEFALATIFERVATFWATLLTATLALALTTSSASEEVRGWLLPMLVVASLLFSLGLGLFFLARTRLLLLSIVRRGVTRLLPAAIGTTDRLLGKTDQFLDRPGVIGHALLVQGVIALCLVARYLLLFEALGISVGWLDMVWVSMLAATLTLLPITVLGLGVREGVLALAFAWIGLSAEAGVLLGLVAFSQLLFLVAMGAVFAVLGKGARPSG